MIGRSQFKRVVNYDAFIYLGIFSREELGDEDYSDFPDAEYDLWFETGSGNTDIILWSDSQEHCELVRDHLYKMIVTKTESGLDLSNQRVINEIFAYKKKKDEEVIIGAE